MSNIIGGSGFSTSLDSTGMRESECSTSPVQADKSNYWVPQLYHRDASNGSYSLIPLVSTKTYYLNRDGPTNKTIAPFPDGLRMIAGNMSRTTYNASNVPDRAVSFLCLEPANPGPVPALPDHSCPGGLRAQITFPSCWNGKDLDSPDHMSHMTYPIGQPDTGDCPAGYTKTITLFNEWVFDVGAFPFTPGAKNWVFSTGDDTGYGFHADFVNGWEPSVLAAAVQQCTGPIFGNLEQCPPFLPTLNHTAAAACKISSVVDENITGPLSALPGCNPSPYTGGARCMNLATPALKAPSASGTAGNPAASATPAAPQASGNCLLKPRGISGHRKRGYLLRRRLNSLH